MRTNKQQPATAYDYRRVILLVQVLAMDKPHDGLITLCDGWEIEPATKYFKDIIDHPVIDTVATIQRLAQHALEAARDERE